MSNTKVTGSCVVWMDHAEAKMFEFLPGADHSKIIEKIIKKHEHHHHTSHEDHSAHGDNEKFFHELATELAQAKEILVVGPGVAKSQFKTHLEKHHHQNTLKNIVGVESCDHPTKNEILAVARKFFKSYDLFH